jgi:putative peptidoglycan lipid II flippase
MSDTRTPVAFAVASMLINLVLSLILVWPFGIKGLALSLSIATIAEFWLLWRTLDRRLGGLDRARITGSVARTLCASLLMAEALGLWLALLRFAGVLDLDIKPEAAFATVGGTVLGAGVFLYASRLLRSAEAETLIQRVPMPPRLRAYMGG